MPIGKPPLEVAEAGALVGDPDKPFRTCPRGAITKVNCWIAAPGRAHYFAAMNAFPVGPDKEAQLAQRMASLGVREADIDRKSVV